jgi:hypothetical protein
MSTHMLGTTLQHPTREGQTGVCTHNTSATHRFSSYVAMPSCVGTSTREAEYTSLSPNFAPEGTRSFMLDSGANDPLMKMTDFSQGTIRPITPANKYDVVYADHDAEEMSERDLKLYHLLPQAQVMAHLAKFGGGQSVDEPFCLQLYTRSLLSPLGAGDSRILTERHSELHDSLCEVRRHEDKVS